MPSFSDVPASSRCGYNKGVKFVVSLLLRNSPAMQCAAAWRTQRSSLPVWTKRSLAAGLCGFGLLLAQQGPERDGNFDIRFEPTAKLQTGVQVPFQINVKDARKQPPIGAKVTLQIEMLDHSRVKVFAAPALNPGVYIAKPVFPTAGDWNVYVEVRRSNEMSSRTIQFSVADSAP